MHENQILLLVTCLGKHLHKVTYLFSQVKFSMYTHIQTHTLTKNPKQSSAKCSVPKPSQTTSAAIFQKYTAVNLLLGVYKGI